MSWGKKYFW